LPSLQYFRDPNPGYRIVMDEVSTFVGEVARSLRAGVNRLCSFSFVVRSDVFVFLFGGKGRACPHRLGRFFDEADFDLEYFPHDWFICCDRLGDSCRINFPVRMYSKILWSPVIPSRAMQFWWRQERGGVLGDRWGGS
jgi:hypothetical protein